MHDRSELVGAWHLRSWDSAFDDGSVGNSMGVAPVGVLVYTADGTVIVTISAADRPPIDGNDPFGGPDDQRLAAMGTFLAYAGSYHLDGTDVIHDVAISLYPNWVGGSQRRHAALSKTAGPSRSARTRSWPAAGRASSASSGGASPADPGRPGLRDAARRRARPVRSSSRRRRVRAPRYNMSHPQDKGACRACDVPGRPVGGSCAYWGRRIRFEGMQDQCAI
jgi:hypothetical protein